jgi:hypothetical protein
MDPLLDKQITNAVELAKMVSETLSPGQGPVEIEPQCNSFLAIGYDSNGINCIRYNGIFIELTASTSLERIAQEIIGQNIGQDLFSNSNLIIGYSSSFVIDCLLVRRQSDAKFTQIGNDDPVNNINAHFVNKTSDKANPNDGLIESSNSDKTQNIQNLLEAAASIMSNLRLYQLNKSDLTIIMP